MTAQLITEFDLWQPGYGGAEVEILVAGTQAQANVFTDEALTIPAANPQTLASLTIDDVVYGKFNASLYTADPYYLSINSAEETGVHRASLDALDGETADNALVTPEGATVARALSDILAEEIYAESYGVMNAVAATVNATLTAAIGAAAGAGGGVVITPAGTYPFTALSIPSNVVVAARGRGVTILQCQTAGNCVTFTGDRAGLRNITLDGVNLQASSVGLFMKACNETILDNVEIKRFETGLYAKGGRHSDWRNLYLENCVTGAKLHGDIDSGNGSDGDEFRDNTVRGGKVSNCTTAGIELKYIDQKAWHNTLEHFGFEDNTGKALWINGARHLWLFGCWWSGNTTNLTVQDGSDTTMAAENTVVGVKSYGGYFSGGTFEVSGTAQDMAFYGMEISDVDFTFTTPTNNILFVDCIEDANVSIAGTGTKFTRQRSILGDPPASAGVTTDAVATKAWSIALNPGDRVKILAQVIGNGRNVNDYATYSIGRSAHRPGSTLAFDTQTANYTAGDIVTGSSSGATARIISQSDSGATGTLTLRDIVGEFVDNETLTSNSGGSALVNGTLSHQNVVLLGSLTSIEAATETDAAWDALFVANGPEVEIQVTGAAAKTVEWTVAARVIVG